MKNFYWYWKRVWGLAALILIMKPIFVSAIETKMLEDGLYYGIFYASATTVPTLFNVNPSSPAFLVSNNTDGNVLGFDWTVYTASAGVNISTNSQFTIATATKTFSPTQLVGSPSLFNNPSAYGLVSSSTNNFINAWYSTSTVIGDPAGTSLNGQFYGIAIDPVINLTTLPAGSTFYIWVEYGRKRGLQ